MIKFRLSSLLPIMIVFFLQLSISFSLSCTNDFSNTEFYTQSGDTVFQLESENSINVINNNLSSHPLTIYMQKTANESGCYALEDFTILEQSNTQTIADQFDEQAGENGDTNYIWTFQLPQTSLITQQYVERRFIYSPTHTSSNPVSSFLYMKVDRNAPVITSLNLRKNSQSLQTNPNEQNSQGLSVNDQVELEVRSSDDISVNDISILSIQGGEVINSSTESISNQQTLLNTQINLTQSPLLVSVRATDEFGKTSDETIEIFFDTQIPNIESMQITSYELTNSLNYKILGEVVIGDDYSINPSLLSGDMSTPNNETADLVIKDNTCEDISGENSTNSRLRCEFSSQVVEIDSTYTADFTFELRDRVDNLVDKSFSEEISIDTNSPEIL